MSPVTSTQIASYSAAVVSSGDPNQVAARTILFRANGSVAAWLMFYRGGATMPPNHFRQDLNAAIVSYRFDAYPSVVDLLRNEEPVYFYWFDHSATGGPVFGIVDTSGEPVGEGELTP